MGPILFDIFVNELEEVIEGIPASLQITPNLTGKEDYPPLSRKPLLEGKTAINGDYTDWKNE